MLVLYNFDRAFHNLTGKWANENKEEYYSFIKSLEDTIPFGVFDAGGAPIIYCIYDTEGCVESAWYYYDTDYNEYEDNLDSEEYEEEINVLDLFTDYKDASQYVGFI